MMTRAWISGPMEKSYVVQLNSFKEKENAQRFITSMKKKGYSPFLERSRKGGDWYHVRVGPYPSRADANEVALDLKKKEGLAVFVLVSMSLDGTRVPSSPPAPEHVAPQQPETEARLRDSGETVDVVVSRFLMWLQSWQERDVEQYLEFYSGDFDHSLGSMKKWKKTRREVFQRSGDIKIEVSDVHMEEVEDTVEMSFIQNYHSNSTSDVGRKTLVWKVDNGQWKIIRETWEPA